MSAPSHLRAIACRRASRMKRSEARKRAARAHRACATWIWLSSLRCPRPSWDLRDRPGRHCRIGHARLPIRNRQHAPPFPGAMHVGSHAGPGERIPEFRTPQLRPSPQVVCHDTPPAGSRKRGTQTIALWCLRRWHWRSAHGHPLPFRAWPQHDRATAQTGRSAAFRPL